MNRPISLPAMLCASLLLSACGGDSPRDPSVDLSAESISARAGMADAVAVAQRVGARKGPVRGSITAEFDGQPRQWDITTLDNPSTFSAGTISKQWNELAVHIRGESSPDIAQPDTGFVLEMTFDADAFKPGASATDVNASLIPHKGLMPPHWTAIDGAKATLVHAEFDGKTGRVEGNLTASLCYRAELYGMPDPRNCKPVELRFASDLALDPDAM